MTEEILIFFQIVFIDLVLAGDNAIIIGMVASQFPTDQRKKIIFWGIGAAIVLRIIFTLITAYLLQISGLRFQILYFRFQISDFRFQISDFIFQISESRFQFSHFSC